MLDDSNNTTYPSAKRIVPYPLDVASLRLPGARSVERKQDNKNFGLVDTSLLALYLDNAKITEFVGMPRQAAARPVFGAQQ